jgi:hypothetical protein
VIFDNLDEFLLGYELGYIIGSSLQYHGDLIDGMITTEEMTQVQYDTRSVLEGRIPEIRQAHTKGLIW